MLDPTEIPDQSKPTNFEPSMPDLSPEDRPEESSSGDAVPQLGDAGVPDVVQGLGADQSQERRLDNEDIQFLARQREQRSPYGDSPATRAERLALSAQIRHDIASGGLSVEEKRMHISGARDLLLQNRESRRREIERGFPHTPYLGEVSPQEFLAANPDKYISSDIKTFLKDWQEFNRQAAQVQRHLLNVDNKSYRDDMKLEELTTPEGRTMTNKIASMVESRLQALIRNIDEHGRLGDIVRPDRSLELGPEADDKLVEVLNTINDLLNARNTAVRQQVDRELDQLDQIMPGYKTKAQVESQQG